MSAFGRFSTMNLKRLLQIFLVQFTLRLRTCKLLAGYLFAIDSMSSGWSCNGSAIALCLNHVRYPQRMTEPLVFYDSTLIDRTQFIVSGIGQRDTGGTDLDLPIGKLIDV